jgi:stage III sporulation protein AD
MVAMRIVLICVAGAILSAVLKAQKPELSMGVAIATGLAALFLSLDGLKQAVTTISGMAQGAGISSESAQLLIRATGVTMLAEFGAQLCRDAGESALAGRIELGGRVILLSMAAPLLTSLTGQLTRLLP